MTPFRLLLAAALVIAAIPLTAATFVVPSDDLLVDKAGAVVFGTVVSSHSRFDANGSIETVSTISVEEVLKGQIATDEVVIVERGGRVGDLALIIPGSARYIAGEQVLAFLAPRGDYWRTVDMILGQFRLYRDPGARALFVRGDQFDTVVGWSTGGEVHREELRDAAGFLDFVRSVAAGRKAAADYFVDTPSVADLLEKIDGRVRPLIRPAPRPRTAAQDTFFPVAPATAYTMDFFGLDPRWARFDGTPQDVTFLTHGTQPGIADSLGAVDRGMAAWNDEPHSTVRYVRGGTTTVNFAFKESNRLNTVIFDDPSSEIEGTFTGSGTLATGGFWASDDPASRHMFNGESFTTILEADLVVQNGVGSFLTQLNFEAMIAHEFGHTLGIRHSEAEQPASDFALMYFQLIRGMGPNLQPWDRDAVATLYGPCVAPVVSAQPASLVRVSPGGSVLLTATAAGTLPLGVEWFRGPVGDTTNRVGEGFSFITGPLREPATFWARAVNACQSVTLGATTIEVVPHVRRRGARRP